jgi:hypothetical protein
MIFFVSESCEQIVRNFCNITFTPHPEKHNVSTIECMFNQTVLITLRFTIIIVSGFCRKKSKTRKNLPNHVKVYRKKMKRGRKSRIEIETGGDTGESLSDVRDECSFKEGKIRGVVVNTLRIKVCSLL